MDSRVEPDASGGKPGLTVEIGPFPLDAYLDPVTREAMVVMGDKVLACRKLDDLEWVRWQRRGWKVMDAGTRRDNRRDDGDPGGAAR